MFRPYKAMINQPLIDWNHCTAWAHTSVYLHAIIAQLHITHAILMFLRPLCVSLCVVALIRACSLLQQLNKNVTSVKFYAF
jgi:hypothetical protein